MVKLRYSDPRPLPPRASSLRAWVANGAILACLGWKNARKVSGARRRRPLRPWQITLKAFPSTSFFVATVLLLTCATVTVVWGVLGHEHVSDLWPEIGGMTLDVFLILIVYEAFAQRRARREAVERQLEIIDDFKRWDAAEARLRIAGALRRLGRFGVTRANFAGARLSDFRFAQHGIPSLRATTFYDGDWGNPLNDSKVELTNVDFSHVDCADVQFSPFDPFEAFDGFGVNMDRSAVLIDCTFANASLVNAVFNGAELRWTKPPPESHFENDEDENGEPYTLQVSQGPFAGADLTGVRFRGCRLHNADFRDAENLRAADFFRAAGLDVAFFDTEEDREWAMASAARSE